MHDHQENTGQCQRSTRVSCGTAIIKDDLLEAAITQVMGKLALRAEIKRLSRVFIIYVCAVCSRQL
jgi:hypothetical protein